MHFNDSSSSRDRLWVILDASLNGRQNQVALLYFLKIKSAHFEWIQRRKTSVLMGEEEHFL